MAKGYLRANPSSEDSRSVCRSGAAKMRVCVHLGVWLGKKPGDGQPWLRRCVSTSDNVPGAGAWVALISRQTEGLLKCTTALVITDQIAISRLWPCSGVQQSSDVATLPPGCAWVCVCVYICSVTLTLRAADVMISETNHRVPGKLSTGDQQEKAFLPMTHNERSRHQRTRTIRKIKKLENILFTTNLSPPPSLVLIRLVYQQPPGLQPSLGKKTPRIDQTLEKLSTYTKQFVTKNLATFMKDLK